MSPAVFFTKFIQIGVSELNRYKWWTLGIPREQKLYWFLPKQLPHDLPPQTVVPRSLWSPMSPPPSWWIGTWSFIPHMFQSPHPGQGCHGNVGIDPSNVCQRKKPRINLVFSHLADAYGEHVKGHKSINSTLSFYLGGMTNCIQRPSFAQNRMSEKFACDNQNLGGLTTNTKHPQIKKTVN